MDEHIGYRFQMPSTEGWEEIIRSCRLSKDQTAALEASLQEAAMRCARLDSRPPDEEIKKALKKLDNAYKRLESVLGDAAVIAALQAIETNGALGYLLSATAIDDFDTETRHSIPTAELNRLLLGKVHHNEEVPGSELDALSLPRRQRQLADQSDKAMRFAVRTMHQPISAWLLASSQNKGGRLKQAKRTILIEVLTRDAMAITGEKASTNINGRFMNLCDWVFPRCFKNPPGVGDAIRRYLENKKIRPWLKWQKLPEIDSGIEPLNQAALDQIPDDPDGDLK